MATTQDAPGDAPRHRLDPPAAGDAGRVPELDALRGLAALGVVLYHSNNRWLPWGWAAVDLFFVLSGYLITAIVLRHGRTPGFLPNFYVRRGLRVWPLYFLTIGLVAAFTPVLRRPPDRSGLPYILTFTQNVPYYWTSYAPAFSPYLLHTWTLALEEQFYLLWPALVLLVGPRRVVPLALGCVAAAVTARAAGLNFTLLAARCDGMALGGLLAACLVSGRPEGAARARLRLALAVVFATGLVTLLAIGGFSGMEVLVLGRARTAVTILAFNLLWLGTVGLAALETGAGALGWLRRPGLCWLGTVSYGLYLIHHALLLVVRDVNRGLGAHKERRWLLLTTIAASIVLAGLSHAWFEAPILRLKERFAYGGGRLTRGWRRPGARAPESSEPMSAR